MRPTLFFLALLATATAEALPTQQEADDPTSSAALRSSTWFQEVTARLSAAEYDFHGQGDSLRAWSAPNRSQDVRSQIGPTGLEVVSRTLDAADPWSLTLRTKRFGRRGNLAELGSAEALGNGARVELDHGPLTEWFVNRPEGLEQGWTLDERPDGRGPLLLELSVGGGFALRLDDDALGGEFVRGDVELPYRGLVAFGADGCSLEAYIESFDSGFRIVVDDTSALYPVTVDPVLQGPSWIAESNQADARLGFSVAAIGDVNSDSFDDVAIGADLFDAGQADEGRVWVFYGSASGLPLSSSWFAESNQAGAAFGRAIAGAGDVNGNGYDDLLIAAPLYDAGQTDEGAVWAYYGSASGLASGSSWFADGDQSGAEYGTSLASAGDVNGDGYDEVVIGVPGFDGSQANEGRAAVYHGGPGGLPSSSNWSKSSGQANARMGAAVASAGDVDGDGYDDLLVGAPGFDGPEVNEGRVWRFDGSAAGLPNGSSWLFDGNQVGAGFGTALAGVGDVNGDGFADYVIGAPYFDAGHLNEGRAWFFEGSATNPGVITWFREGNQTGAQFGRAIAGAGDVNGDGYDDVVVAAPQYDGQLVDEGRAWLYLGTPLGPSHPSFWIGAGNQSGALYGTALAGGCDVDGDDYDDVLVGVPGFDGGQANEGRAYLYSGTPDIGSHYCASTPNSTGSPALITAFGSPSVTAGTLTLEAGPVPNGFGLFIHSGSAGQSTLGDGFLCISGSFVRCPVVSTSTNVASFTFDNSTIHHSLNAYTGTTRHFQMWFRDATPTGYNLSDGVLVRILP